MPPGGLVPSSGSISPHRPRSRSASPTRRSPSSRSTGPRRSTPSTRRCSPAGRRAHEARQRPDLPCVVLTGSRNAGVRGRGRHQGDWPAADARRRCGPAAAFEHWDELAGIGVPIVAAVRGYALGGGCELAMACDLIVAGEDARSASRRSSSGSSPGPAARQRLTRAIGKARAMELILTGRSIDAREAEAARPRQPRRARRGDASTARSSWPAGSRRCRRSPCAPPRHGQPAAEELPLSGGPGRRAAGLLRPVRDRRPDRGDGRVRRETDAPMARTLRRGR